ncbi:hypothetical protein [Anaerovibrio sp. RM50]|uniref:hypothetical protein n=1 Tax=Anaerovibrio sp. RM50 TaxID=1200557 RepID=UPI00048804B8|nr:hypothetical protein [Anaerovibrio sp. RM50]
MGKILKNFITFSWLLFLGLVLVLAGFSTLMLVFHDIPGMIRTGFAGTTAGFSIFGTLSFVVMITGFVPLFRRCYYIFPWLYPFTTMLMINLFIAALAEFILGQGFSVTDSQRYEITICLMIIMVIICRFIMSLYFKIRPIVYQRDDR